jgi:Mg2+/Co2+ transporter CorB
MIAGLVAAILVLLVLSAFISGSETALTAASRARLHQLEKEGHERAAQVNGLLAQQERLIGSLLLANNLANIFAAVLATVLAISVFGLSTLTLALAGALMALLILIFSEVMPKTYALSKPEETAMFAAPVIRVLFTATSWLAGLIQMIVSGLFSLTGWKRGVADGAAEEEIRGAIELHTLEGSVDEADRKRLVGALDLKDLTVVDVMIHRKNIKMLDAGMDRRQLVMKALGSPHTRLPLYQGEKEEIVGVLHAKDLLRAALPLGGDLSRLDLEQIARKPWFVPDTTPVQDQLEAFLSRREHFALVVDEYGELMGLITLEDILEEIVGHIHDEHDVAVQGVRPQADGSVNVDGWVPIRDLNRVTGWSLPDDEAVTVAGLVIHEAQTLPEPGQSFVFHGHRFNILRRQRNQVTGLNVSRLESEAAEA